MKVLIDRVRLVNALSTLAPLTKGQSLNPLGHGVLIETAENKVLVRATNIDQTMEWRMEALVEQEGEVVVPLANLLSLIKNITEEEVVLVTQNAGLECQYGEKRATLATYQTDDFPLLPSAGEETVVVVEANDIKAAVSEVVYAVAGKNAIKPIAAGINFFLNGEVVLLASDGYRLARSQLKVKEIKGMGEYVVPGKSLGMLGSLEGELKVSFSQNSMKLETEECRLFIQLLAGEFPRLEEHIPKNYQTRVVFQKEALIQGLKRVLAFDPTTIDIEVDEDFGMKAESESGKIEENIPARIEGAAIKSLFSPYFLLEAVKVTPGEEISVGIAGEDLPLVIETAEKEKFCALILPMRKEEA